MTVAHDEATWDERYAASDLVWSATPNRFVERELADLPPGRALDLAGGEGRNALWLAERGWDVELVDFSRVALDKARRRAEQTGRSVTLTHADLTASAALAPADLVLVAYLQLPPAPLRRVLHLAAAAVAPGGTLLVVAHAKRNLTEGVGGPSDPSVLPDLAQVRDALVGTGLAIEVAEEVARPVEVEGEVRTAIDVLLRARRGVLGS